MNGDITQLLSAASAGDRDALDRVFDLLYRELRGIARRQLAGGETLRTTALVHEVYLRMARGQPVVARDREHFYATASRAMRQILVDHARRRSAEKRGGGVRAEALDDQIVGTDGREEEILAIDAALRDLEAVDGRLARLVEMRFYGGLSIEETAEMLGISERTVKRDWRKARAFLYRQLHGSAA